ncbi:MAG: 16S rRNA (adenine(1518)-N(6)/adenine(1519)-N(6))-dimethyltransferase RsmA [Bacteroidetes bacterium]|nr:16S rRNA (adenine(1518)-N(6)/adenine(1519)-N(6))-dimethyltransferase RsmA [Bacteroidota bacterium]
MNRIRAKKNLGQHFLKDADTAKRIVESLSGSGYQEVLEIGPGMGILTHFLFQHHAFKTIAVDVDAESIHYLQQKFPEHADHFLHADVLQFKPEAIFPGQFAVIGNFPYNISSQILFKILENKNHIPEVTGMFQKEVGVRIASEPGNRDYGILSVFMQAFYNVELLFFLDEKDFDPPPKVKSAVLHFTRKQNEELGCDEKLFFRVVKAAFNQRRKTLRNALSHYIDPKKRESIPYLDKRAEALSWQQFSELTNHLVKSEHTS